MFSLFSTFLCGLFNIHREAYVLHFQDMFLATNPITFFLYFVIYSKRTFIFHFLKLQLRQIVCEFYQQKFPLLEES